MDSVEASGKSIEDAILQALARLGRNRDEVDITVLQEPSRGTRGMGAREARVRVYLKRQRAGKWGAGVVTPEMADVLMNGEEPLADADPYADEGEYAGDGDAYPYDGQAADPRASAAPPEVMIAALRDVLSEDASIEEFAVLALQTILAHMGVNAEVVAADTPEDEPLLLDIVPLGDASLGDSSLAALIGRRGETLAALQLLVNLITYKQTGEHERIIVDVEGYRARREENLRSMAERIAQQVRGSGRPMMLEAMPPNERRIIHMALSEYEDISTESTGEGDQRRVVVSPKHGAPAP
ncbi:MAG: protein jag [Ktedonobacterales bacterium]|nr:protein jag [Ktedonobacterales bacterium]